MLMASMDITIGYKTLLEFRGKVLVAGLLMSFFASPLLAAGNPITGKIKSISCQVCHGKDGHSNNPSYPILAGQHAQYTAKQMHDFKNNIRIDPVMNEMASGLSDQDIDDISAYFQSVK